MATTKKLKDLITYASVLPYASELFGIYQPLLGWKSKRTQERFDRGFSLDKRRLLERFTGQFVGNVDLTFEGSSLEKIALQAGKVNTELPKGFESVLLTAVARDLPRDGDLTDEQWVQLLKADKIRGYLKDAVVPQYEQFFATRLSADAPRTGAAVAFRPVDQEQQRAAFEGQLRYESSIAGALQFLVQSKNFQALRRFFGAAGRGKAIADALASMLASEDAVAGHLGLDNLNPRDEEELRRVALSPISVVHLFRQYFFELDSFLGTPVGHVWLSPGSTVELIEVQTKREFVEKTVEQALETTAKSEKETTNEDEISDAVKRDNKQDIKFGASVTASYSGITASSSFDYDTSQQTAREETHKRTRKQTEKLSSEIRKSYKTTFRTITETTDTSSKRYLLNNTTGELINYELRRKMRQVAVQVQDVGTYLCWQTYVDTPGESLGVAKLLNIAKPAELDGLIAPDEIPLLEQITEQTTINIPFIARAPDTTPVGEYYVNGIEGDNQGFEGPPGIIQYVFDFEFTCPKGLYLLDSVELDPQGKEVTASDPVIKNEGSKATVTIAFPYIAFAGQRNMQLGLGLHWTPSGGANQAIVDKNAENLKAFTRKESAEFQKAFLETAKQRIKLIHQITSRPSEELREEERIVVYRKLIQDMLMAGVTVPDDRTRHVVAELINSIFDVDKMLYFVAPEWWRPRLRGQVQQLEPTKSVSTTLRDQLGDALTDSFKKQLGLTSPPGKPDKLAASTVGWGGTDDPNRDNYFITEDSNPAKFGSSLGWLLQLDGDNMRNAFLNAPWVKAVVPIRPGKEEAAINWLKGVEGLNGIDGGTTYQTNNLNEKDINGKPLNGQPMIDVIVDLARKIQQKHQEGIETGKYPKESEVADPQLVDEDNVVTSTPIDRVYEHGFFPLAGGFRANVQANYEIFDQWLEVLPTDQVVPVEVKYDPKTGRQL